MKDDLALDAERETGTTAQVRAVERVKQILAVRPLSTSGDEEEWLTDLLADLRHWTDAQENVDFDDCEARAFRHYDSERD